MSRKQADGFVALPFLLLGVLLVVGILAILQVATKPPAPPAPPMYKVGECGKNSVDPDSETSGSNDSIFKIVAVGKKNYQYLLGRYSGKTVHVKVVNQSIQTLDPGTEKVECTKELNDPKTLEKARGEGN